MAPGGFEQGVFKLYHFSDASERSYGACSYLRIITPEGKIHVALLASKGRLAPLKTMTIPRLELTAAVTAVKLDQLIRKHFELHTVDSKFWSDSEIVLAYINNETKRFNTFVANRVSQIRQVSEPCQWCHVPGKFNPADVISRGCQAGNLPNMWFEGPKFLWDYKANWPVSRTAGDVLSGDLEVKPQAAVHSGAVVTDDDVTSPRGLTKLMDHYSSYYQLRKAVCWLTRFLRHLQGQTISPGPITWPEMEVAGMQIIKFV